MHSLHMLRDFLLPRQVAKVQALQPGPALRALAARTEAAAAREAERGAAVRRAFARDREARWRAVQVCWKAVGVETFARSRVEATPLEICSEPSIRSACVRCIWKVSADVQELTK